MKIMFEVILILDLQTQPLLLLENTHKERIVFYEIICLFLNQNWKHNMLKMLFSVMLMLFSVLIITFGHGTAGPAFPGKLRSCLTICFKLCAVAVLGATPLFESPGNEGKENVVVFLRTIMTQSS